MGAAKALRLMGKRSVALTYFGEGCASEGDIPSALNIAAVHKAPAIFFCRNNGYAISTQVHERQRGGVGGRGDRLDGWVAPPAYGCAARPKRRVHLRDVAAAEGCGRC